MRSCEKDADHEGRHASQHRTARQLFIPDIAIDFTGSAITISPPIPIEYFAPTNPFLVNPTLSIERAKYHNVDGYKLARRQQLTAMNKAQLRKLAKKRQALKTQLEYAEIEENIIKCRHMLVANEEAPDDVTQAKVYLVAAIPVFQKYMDSMTELKLINAKITQVPKLPIKFTEEETSELYWWLVKYGCIDYVANHIAKEYENIRAQYQEKLEAAGGGSWELEEISRAIVTFAAAANE